jgi:hypothetical protein
VGGSGGFGLEQAYADHATVLADALARVPVELELANDYGGKVNPTGAQLLERHRLLASVPQSHEHPAVVEFQRAPSTRFLAPFSLCPSSPRSQALAAPRKASSQVPAASGLDHLAGLGQL